ncbi:MarR family winged helix-turn-helix transcriptional regulator [Paenibacillus sp. GCM10023252]|uniref:MarR family winged helix-turn-helix transcriptional regulator n=1 Tax=Paenibacillus sp. GCM10023252 TaxID=3252649 RepID=UPI00360D09B3
MEKQMHDTNLGRMISLLYRQFQMHINRELKALGINSSQYIYLANLYEKDGMNQEALSSALYIDKAATARALDKLETSGYIRREVDARDKRSKCVYLTEQALSVRPIIMEALMKWNQIIQEDLSVEEIMRTSETLSRMSNSVLSHASGGPIGEGDKQ